MENNTFNFIGTNSGPWKVLHMNTLLGDSLKEIPYLRIEQSNLISHSTDIWTLKGFTSNVRYATKGEKEDLAAIQEGLGRPEASLAALIPIRKNEAWWNLAQDERRKVFEIDSHHTEIGLKYLPAIARKLFHCRDLGQPFDFLTWFEYAPEHEGLFNELLSVLRNTEEWKYIDREIDIRLQRD